MGMHMGFSSSNVEGNNMGMFGDRSISKLGEGVLMLPPNPDPSKFRVIAQNRVKEHLVIKVYYPDCTNYEGIKILVFLDVDLDDILAANEGRIDPHFSDKEGYVHPFARFEPTRAGWFAAQALVAMM